MKYLLLLFMVGLTGCSFFVKKPEVNVTSITINGLDNKGMGIDLLMAVKNRNSYKLDLTGYRYELLVSSASAAKGESRDRVELPGDAVTDVTIPLRIEFADLINIMKSSSNPGRLPYKINASLDMSTPMGNFTIPIEKQGDFSLPHNLFMDRILKKLR